MATKFYINRTDTEFVLSQAKKEGFEVDLNEEETEIMKALIESLKFKSILEKCAEAGYFLQAKQQQTH